MAGLEKRRRAARASAEPVSARLEMTAVSDFVLRQGGPALLFENPAGYKIPVLTNLFGTARSGRPGDGRRRRLASCATSASCSPTSRSRSRPRACATPAGCCSMAKALWDMQPGRPSPAPPCREVVLDGAEVDLGRLPVQTCWPEDAGPLITWGLVITRGPQGGPAARKRQNLGIYRQQVIGRRQVIMRWLAHRGGALDFREFAAQPPWPAVSDRRRARRRPGDDPRRRHAGARQPLRIPVRRPAARQPHRGERLRRSAMAG